MKKRDFILIGAVLAVILRVFAVVFFTKKEGDYVVVKVNGEEVAKYSLLEDGVYELNGGTNILKIEDGKAFLIEASCPDHLCMNQGKIDQSGETITCLPNRLTVSVYSSDKNEAGSDVDIVVD